MAIDDFFFPSKYGDFCAIFLQPKALCTLRIESLFVTKRQNFAKNKFKQGSRES
jgi:hypothetical protein